MRGVLISMLALVAALAACTTVPDSGAGVGFDNSVEAQRAREAALQTGAPLPPPSAISEETLAPVAPSIELQNALPTAGSTTIAASDATLATNLGAPTQTGNAADIAADTAAVLGTEPLQASPTNPPPQPVSNPGISDENDFDAVSGRQSIESDAERLAQASAQRQEVQPTALPERDGSASPNIVAYALSTNHARGTRIHSRTGLNLTQKSIRACANYPSPDQAQIAFLQRGGPNRDRLGLDPDGDGYACDWDPAPFRAAVGN
ncbi:MAG: hypothetical protein AAGA05_00130 [Pseudomonadota bacterium]